MEEIYLKTGETLKVISDPKRLRIIDMLSCGELCACELLEAFDISQPTLSHDMKLLIEKDLVKSRREGKNTYYSLNEKSLSCLLESLREIFNPSKNCICHKKSNPCGN